MFFSVFGVCLAPHILRSSPTSGWFVPWSLENSKRRLWDTCDRHEMLNSVGSVFCAVLFGVGKDVVPPFGMDSLTRGLVWEMVAPIARIYRQSCDTLAVGAYVVGIIDLCSRLRIGGITMDFGSAMGWWRCY